MQRAVSWKQAPVRSFVIVLAAAFTAACVGAGGAGVGGGLAPQRQRATIANGTFTVTGPVNSYGPDASLGCRTSGAFQVVLDELAGVAKRAGKPAPVADGRLCAVAEAFLGWDPAMRPRPAALELASHAFGLVSTVQAPNVATIESEDPREIADRVVQAVGTPVLNAVRPLIGMATTGSARALRGGATARTKVSVVIVDGAVDVDPFPRRLEAGQQASLKGRLYGELTGAKVTVSDPAGHVTTADSPGAQDFAIDLKCGNQPGEMRVEVRGQRDSQSGVLANFPVACATQLPTSVAVAPEQWPTDTAQAERKILDLVNAQRSAIGLKPLEWDDDVAKAARAVAESLKDGGTGGNVRERLKQVGVASPVVLQSLAADRSPERAQERLANSPTNRSNMLNADVTSAGVGLFQTKDEQGSPLVYLAEVLVKKLPPVDVEQTRAKLRDAVERKRKDSRTTPVKSDPVLEEVAAKYAQALAAGGGTIAQDEAARITNPLNTAFKAVSMVAGAKEDPLDFAEEPQVVSKGSALGVGVAEGKNAVLGRNATYVVIMIGAPRAEGKATKAPKKPRTK